MNAGKPHGIAPTGPSDIRRVEAGILNYGADMTLENNPYEVGLGWLVDFDQDADFIGKDALKRIKAEGVSRKLVGIEISGAPIDFNMTKWPALAGDEPVGLVTSALFSPRLKKNIGYAMVPIDEARRGNTFAIRTGNGDEREATVVKKPFVDPAKEIPKS